MYLTATKEMKNIAQENFDYTGRKYEIQVSYHYVPSSQRSGGSRTDFVLVYRENLKVVQSNFILDDIYTGDQLIPPNHFVVERRFFCGKNMGIRFIIRPDECDTGMLPPNKEELSQDEKIALLATLHYKSSYQGIKDYRRYMAVQETNITEKEYSSAKQSLIDKGFLTKAGAATLKGKNFREKLPSQLYELEKVSV